MGNFNTQVRNFFVLAALPAALACPQQAQALQQDNNGVVQRFTCGTGATSNFVANPHQVNPPPPPTFAPFAFGNGNNRVDPISGSILAIATPQTRTDNETAGGCVIYRLVTGLTHAPFRHLEFFYLQKNSDAEEHTTIIFAFRNINGHRFTVTKNLEADFIDPFNETQDNVPNGWTRAFADPSFFGREVGHGDCVLEEISFFMTSSDEEALTMKFGNVSITTVHQFESPASLVNVDAGCAGENPTNFR